MRFLTRLFVAVGLLTVIYILVAAGRNSAGVQIELWGQNPQPVCNHQPAGQLLPPATDHVANPSPLRRQPRGEYGEPVARPRRYRQDGRFLEDDLERIDGEYFEGIRSGRISP